MRKCLTDYVCNGGNYYATDDLDALKKKVKTNTPDFLIADIYSRNNGVDVVGEITSAVPADNVILVTTINNKYLSYYESRYGVKNFIFAEDDIETIRAGFDEILKGGASCSFSNISALTARECEILKLIAAGKTSKEIADELCISKNTVDTHRNKMLQKLNITNSASLVQFAYYTGLF